jgi:hypothetical protein
MKTAMLSVEDIYYATSEGDSNEQQPVPVFGEAVTVFEMMWRCITSFPIDDASMQQLTELEREMLFHQTCQTKQTALLDYFYVEVTHLHMYVFIVFQSQDNTHHGWNSCCIHECDLM